MKRGVTGGIGGAIALLGFACPVCIPALAAVLASAGVLVGVSAIIKPLMWVMLSAFWFGLLWAYRSHRNPWPLAAGVVLGVLTYWVRYEWYYAASTTRYIAWYDWRIALPALGLMLVAIWNYRLDQKHTTCNI